MELDLTKSFTKIVIVILYLVLVCTGVYSAFSLIRDYNIKSWIIGQFYEEPTVTKLSDFEYTFNSLLFNATGNENEFICSATVSKVAGFDRTKEYTTTVNGELSKRVSGDYEFVSSIHTKKFYDVNNNELASDDLQITINFYENETAISLITRGGENALGYWQAFIKKNGLAIHVVETDYSSEIEADNLPKYELTLYALDEIYQTINFNAFKDFELPTNINGHEIKNWTDEYGNIYTKETLPLENKSLYANLVLTFNSVFGEENIEGISDMLKFFNK